MKGGRRVNRIPLGKAVGFRWKKKKKRGNEERINIATFSERRSSWDRVLENPHF